MKIKDNLRRNKFNLKMKKPHLKKELNNKIPTLTFLVLSKCSNDKNAMLILIFTITIIILYLNGKNHKNKELWNLKKPYPIYYLLTSLPPRIHIRYMYLYIQLFLDRICSMKKLTAGVH